MENYPGPKVTTPEDRGVPKWTGTPEEATNMVRAAAHMCGSPNVSVLEYDNDTRKLLYDTMYSWEDVDECYGDPTRTSSRGLPICVYPLKLRWAASFVVRQEGEGTKRDPSRQTGISRYWNDPIILQRMQRFIKALGYQAPGACSGQQGYSAAGVNVGLGVLCGQGELTRINQQNTPEWGTMGGFTPGLPTDLPLAPTRPIDFGAWKFCEACKICAEICHEAVGNRTVISLDTEPTWEISGPWNRVGVKKYQQPWPSCGGCGVANCARVCPFNTHGKGYAPAHEVIKATVATTAIFNGFLTSMEKYFYPYPLRSEEEFAAWWDRDLRTWPYDTILGAGSGPNGGV